MHPDPEAIIECALGELPDPERAIIEEHCQTCADCRDALATSLLLARVRAGGFVKADGRLTAPWTRYVGFAAAVLLSLGLAGYALQLDFSSNEDLASGQQATPDESPGELTPRQQLVRTDEGIRSEIVAAGRFWFPTSIATTSSVTGSIPRSLDAFEAGDFDLAATHLASDQNLPAFGIELLGASFFYAGRADEAMTVFEDFLGPSVNATERPEYWDSFRSAAVYYLARMYLEVGRPADAIRIAQLALGKQDLWADATEFLLAESR